MQLTVQELGVLFLPVLFEVFDMAVDSAVQFSGMPRHDRASRLPGIREAAGLISNRQLKLSVELSPGSD